MKKGVGAIVSSVLNEHSCNALARHENRDFGHFDDYNNPEMVKIISSTHGIIIVW